MNDKIIKVELNKIDAFKEHPFLVNNDSSLIELVKSIKENGLLNPMIVRKKENGRYELISGHRRKKALEILGIQEIEVVVNELNDDEATIFMVDSNMYRDRVLPSEVTLFERGNNLIMTPEAEELLPYVEEALNNLKNGE